MLLRLLCNAQQVEFTNRPIAIVEELDSVSECCLDYMHPMCMQDERIHIPVAAVLN